LSISWNNAGEYGYDFCMNIRRKITGITGDR